MHLSGPNSETETITLFYIITQENIYKCCHSMCHSPHHSLFQSQVAPCSIWQSFHPTAESYTAIYSTEKEVQRKRMKKGSPQDRERISVGENENMDQDNVYCMTYPKKKKNVINSNIKLCFWYKIVWCKWRACILLRDRSSQHVSSEHRKQNQQSATEVRN